MIDCTEAQRLIDQGMLPDSQSPTRAQLGFHLAACSRCRSYYTSQTSLLQALLKQVSTSPCASHPQSPPVPTEPVPAPAPTPHESRQRLRFVPEMLLLLIPVIAVIGLIAMQFDTQQPTTSLTTPPSTPTIATLDTGNLAPGTPTITPAATTTPIPPPAQPDQPDQIPTTPPVLTQTTLVPATVPTSAAAAPLPTEAAPPPSPWPTIEVLPSPVIAADTTPMPRSASTAPGNPDTTITILLLGHDLRPGEQDIPRTDAIMLVHIDPKAYRIALLSLPRDLWVSIPGYGNNRINAAYRIAEQNQPGTGLEVARTTISKLLDIPIDYVALIGFEEFMSLVDAIGGITVNVERELYDAEFPTMDYGYTVAHFLPGPQHMDGLTALTYSRTRHPDSDFMRILRQQNTLISIGRRLRERGDLQDMLTVEQITTEIAGFVETDMPREHIVQVIWAMRAFDTTRIERYALGAEGVTFGVGDDQYALVPSRAALNDLSNQLLGAP